MENLVGHVSDVKILSSHARGGKSGPVITFLTNEVLQKDHFVEIMLTNESSNRTYAFQIADIEISDRHLLVRAWEIRCRYSLENGVDIRTVVGADVRSITDKERISNLRERLTYC